MANKSGWVPEGITAMEYIIKRAKEYPKEVQKLLKHEATQAVGRMKKDAPVDTGRLRRGIKVGAQAGAGLGIKEAVTITSKAIDPDTNADYAADQEFGSRYIPAHPYFFKNVRLMRKKITKRAERLLKSISQ